MDSKMKIQPNDLILLEHADFLYMQQEMSKAHQKVEKKYNYAKALKKSK